MTKLACSTRPITFFFLCHCRHVVYAPSSVNQYGSSLFPGVSDAIFSAVEFGGSWDEVRHQLDLVRIHLLYASHIMDQQYSVVSEQKD